MGNRRLIISSSVFLAIGAYSFVSAQATNIWTNVTPAGINLTNSWGSETVGFDPLNPSTLYANFNDFGIYRSTDYGATWTGPINTGANGTNATGDGNLTVVSGGAGNPATIYGGFEHNSPGFWRSTDGGVSWQNFTIAPAGGRQDIFPPDADPYDPKHVIVTGHEHTSIYESKDGGQTWSNVAMNAGMNSTSGFAFFINTGNATTTAQTLLWIGQNGAGTWRTSNDGANWTRVDNNCSPSAGSQIFQAGNGVIFMAGQSSSLGSGVLRSTDYGQTWAHVGPTVVETGVFGTPNHVFAMNGAACVPCAVSPALEIAPQPGTTGWLASTTPAGMTGGGFSQAAVIFDGTHYIVVVSCWNKGLWRYVESSTSSVVNHYAAVRSNMVRRNEIKMTRTGIVIRATESKSFDVTGRIVDAR